MRFPFRLLHDWQERRRALRELGRIERDEFAILALDDSNLVNQAKVSVEVGDLRAAGRYWDGALARYAGFAKSHKDALAILIGLRRFDEAEALMLDGVKNAPRDASYAEGYASVARERGEIAEAVIRWADVRKKHPKSWKAYVQGVGCLIQAGDADAAEELARVATRRFPEVESAWMEWARVAELRKDWAEALRRWEFANKKFRHTIVDLGMARVLVELGRFDEADDSLRQAQYRDPLWPQIATERARLARLKGDRDGEVLRWADVRRRFPLLALGYQEGFRRLLDMGRIADAEQVLLAAMEQFSTEPWPAEEYAGIASHQQDWEAAKRRWAAVRAKWPDREKAYRLGAAALIGLGCPDEAAQLQLSLNDKRTGE